MDKTITPITRWFRNKKTGIEFEVSHSGTIKMLLVDYNFEEISGPTVKVTSPKQNKGAGGK